MAITHSTDQRADIAEAVKAFMETGSGTATLRVKDADGITLIDFELPDPAYTSDEAGDITLDGVPLYATAAATGTAAAFTALNRNGATAYEGTVGAFGSAEDLKVTNLNVVSGQRCGLLAHVYRAPV